MPACQHIFNFGKPPAEVPPNYQTHLWEMAPKGWGHFLREIRIWECLEPEQAFAQRNLNPFFLMVEVGDEEDAQEMQSCKKATHWLRCFGLHMAPDVSEDNFEVAQAVGHLVQQYTCSRCLFKAEIV